MITPLFLREEVDEDLLPSLNVEWLQALGVRSQKDQDIILTHVGDFLALADKCGKMFPPSCLDYLQNIFAV
jgi:hypothetical protein